MMVARTILDQLGGYRFIAFTGCKNFKGYDNSLTMNLARNVSGANRLKITLTPMDLYDMEFYRETGGKLNKDFELIPIKRKTVRMIEGVYCDQLEDFFTKVTGLHTRI